MADGAAAFAPAGAGAAPSSQQQQQPQQQPQQPQQQQEQEEDPRVVLKREWEEAVRRTRPKDAAAGVKSGLATAAAGVASGVVGLFAAPIVGAHQDGASGFAKGLATGIAGAVVLPVAGVVGGAVQLGRGLANQGEALKEKKRGRVWNKETHEWEDPPGTDMAPYDADAAARALGGAAGGGVDYYALLEVPRDADAAAIKRQYYVLARKWHPDKNPGSAEATERFQQLGHAYQVLSSPELRARYDRHGAAGLDVEFADAGVIFGMLFGSELFEPIVGEFLIAAATSRGRELSEREVRAMQDARVAKLLVQLRARLEPYLAGEADAFREVQTINAQQLAAASFGGVMLQTVARVYQTEAEIAQGNALSGGLTKLRRAGDSLRSQLQAAKAAVDLAQHQAKLEAADAALRQHAAALQERHGLNNANGNSNGDGHGDGNGDGEGSSHGASGAGGGELPEAARAQLAGMMLQRHELELAGMGLALQAMWAANVLDIQRTLHGVCKRLLREPGLPKPEAKRRAAALLELARIYGAARPPPELATSHEQQLQAAIEKLKELYTGGGGGGGDEAAAGASAGGGGGGGAQWR